MSISNKNYNQSNLGMPVTKSQQQMRFSHDDDPNNLLSNQMFLAQLKSQELSRHNSQLISANNQTTQ